MTLILLAASLLGVVAKVKNRRHSVKKVRNGDGKYSKISNNCTRFESNTR